MPDLVAELRARARRALGIERLHARIDLLEAELRAVQPGGWDRSRKRWREVQPDAGLTWGQELSGDAFITKVNEHGGFAPSVRVLEIGPGYGRLPQSMLALEMPFSQYLGLDISPSNVAHLRQRFEDPRVQFAHGDAESTALDGSFDLLVSSLVFKHLYPTFEKTLAHCGSAMRAGALACFDLIEGDHSIFEDDGATYIKCYPRGQVDEILDRSGFDRVAFDSVRHDDAHVRLLVVARRRGSA